MNYQLSTFNFLKTNVLKKESSQPISRVLSSHESDGLSFILVECCHPTLAFYPVARTSSPQALLYMNLQLPRCTAAVSPQSLVGSYPTFSPLPHLQFLNFYIFRRGGCFLLHYSTLADCFYIRKWNALCCPDFPLAYRCRRAYQHMPATDRPTAFNLQN